MQLEPSVFDLWVFRRQGASIEYLLLHTSQQKADRYFGGGRFWQIPSNLAEDGEKIEDAIDRVLTQYSLTASAIWAAEHVYTIYNRRFECMQIISVFAVEVPEREVTLDPFEHASYRWCSYAEAQSLVHYRGLKDGLRSTYEYVTGVPDPAIQLKLR